MLRPFNPILSFPLLRSSFLSEVSLAHHGRDLFVAIKKEVGPSAAAIARVIKRSSVRVLWGVVCVTQVSRNFSLHSSLFPSSVPFLRREGWGEKTSCRWQTDWNILFPLTPTPLASTCVILLKSAFKRVTHASLRYSSPLKKRQRRNTFRRLSIEYHLTSTINFSCSNFGWSGEANSYIKWKTPSLAEPVPPIQVKCNW